MSNHGEDRDVKKDEKCPHCGYCPHCGRSDAPVKTVPYPMPYPYPVVPAPRPYPFRPTWIGDTPKIYCGGSGNVGVAPRENLAINATVMH